jgi:two-component system OmpR family response regulator
VSIHGGLSYSWVGGAAALEAIVKILLLEDDAKTAAFIDKGLRSVGHVVDTCATGRDAIFHATDGAYDVLVIDRMVPAVDGLAALKALRSTGITTPTIFLTAMDGVEDRVEGLEAGADDYLVKPFAMTELIARIDALARRPHLAQTQTRIRVGDLEIDLLKRNATRAGRSIELQAQEFKLLEYLMRHAGQIVTRTMLLENIWSFHFDPQTNIIEGHVSRLRAKIDRGFGSEMIKTVRGAGYMIDATA